MNGETPSQDIRRFFMTSNTKHFPSDLAEGEGGWGVVWDKDEDGNELITHTAYIDRGSSLFSMDLFDEFQEMGQDKLGEITYSYWNI